MRGNERHERWNEHLPKISQFAEMITSGLHTFYSTWEHYDDSVVDAILDKLQVDLEGIIQEYNKAVNIVPIIPQSDPYDADIDNFERAKEKKRELLDKESDTPTSFLYIEECPPKGEGYYSVKFTCPDCKEEIETIANTAYPAHCKCSIWSITIHPNKALRVDRVPYTVV